MKIKKKIHKYPYNRSFTNGIHSLSRRADAKESAYIIYLVSDAYR